MTVDRDGVKTKRYWGLKEPASIGIFRREETIERVRELFVATCGKAACFWTYVQRALSGGLDSSLITAVAARHMGEKQLSTYSFDYEDNDKYFKASAFQPDADAPWVVRMSGAFNTNHTKAYLQNSYLL